MNKVFLILFFTFCVVKCFSQNTSNIGGSSINTNLRSQFTLQADSGVVFGKPADSLSRYQNVEAFLRYFNTTHSFWYRGYNKWYQFATTHYIDSILGLKGWDATMQVDPNLYHDFESNGNQHAWDLINFNSYSVTATNGLGQSGSLFLGDVNDPVGISSDSAGIGTSLHLYTGYLQLTKNNNHLQVSADSVGGYANNINFTSDSFNIKSSQINIGLVNNNVRIGTTYYGDTSYRMLLQDTTNGKVYRGKIADVMSNYMTLNTAQTTSGQSVKVFSPTASTFYATKFQGGVIASADNQVLSTVLIGGGTYNANGYSNTRNVSLHVQGKSEYDSLASFDQSVKDNNHIINYSIDNTPYAKYWTVYDSSNTQPLLTIYNTSGNMTIGNPRTDSLHKLLVNGSIKGTDSVVFSGLDNGVQTYYNLSLGANNHVIKTVPAVATFATISQMQADSGMATSAFVQDSLRGGWFYLTTGLTEDSAIVFSAIGRGSGYYWKRQKTLQGQYIVTWWPGVVDDSTNSTAGIQQATNYIYNHGGGDLIFPKITMGIYVGQDTIKSTVNWVGSAKAAYPYNVSDTTEAQANAGHNIKWIQCDTCKEIVSTPPAPATGNRSLSGITIKGFSFAGLGSAYPLNAIHLVSTAKVYIQDCQFYNISGSVVVQDSSYSHHSNGTLVMKNCNGQFLLLNRSALSRYTGILDLHGNDNIIQDDCEFNGYGGSNTPPASNGFVCGFTTWGSDNHISGLFENIDIGGYIAPFSTRNVFDGKIDQTQKEGLIVDSTYSNIIANVIFKRTGQKTTNTYIAVSAIRSAKQNTFANLTVTNLGGTSTGVPAYAFGESGLNQSYDPTQRNTWANCTAKSGEYGTALFAPNNVAGGSFFNPSQALVIDTSTTGTPNVNNISYLVYNSSHGVTNFINPNSGQYLWVYYKQPTTVTYNTANIILQRGTSYTYPAGSLVQYRLNDNGVWVEEGSNSKQISNYIDSPEHTIATSISWNGSAPTGSSNTTYQWQQVGNWITIRVNLEYASAGATNTSVSFALPSDVPAPKVPAGYSGASNVLYTGTGILRTSSTQQNPNAGRSFLTINGSSTGYNIIIATNSSLSATNAEATIEYPVQ